MQFKIKTEDEQVNDLSKAAVRDAATVVVNALRDVQGQIGVTFHLKPTNWHEVEVATSVMANLAEPLTDYEARNWVVNNYPPSWVIAKVEARWRTEEVVQVRFDTYQLEGRAFLHLADLDGQARPYYLARTKAMRDVIVAAYIAAAEDLPWVIRHASSPEDWDATVEQVAAFLAKAEPTPEAP